MTADDGDFKAWHDLPARRQLELREEYGHYLDRLPPTCSMQSKVERFRLWLRKRGVFYPSA